MLLAVISNGIAIGNEFNILIVVECDHICICVGSDRYCLAFSGNRGVADDICRFFGNYCVKRLVSYYMVCFDRLIRSVPIVVYGVAEVVLDFILCGVGNIFCDGFSNRRIPTCEFIAIVGGNGRCFRSFVAPFYTGCYIAIGILTGKIAVIALVIGNGAFRSRALYAGDVEVASDIIVTVFECKSRYAVGWIILIVNEAVSRGVELNGVGKRVGISLGAISVVCCGSSSRCPCDGSVVNRTVGKACVLKLDVLTHWVGHSKAGAQTLLDGRKDVLKRAVKIGRTFCVKSIARITCNRAGQIRSDIHSEFVTPSGFSSEANCVNACSRFQTTSSSIGFALDVPLARRAALLIGFSISQNNSKLFVTCNTVRCIGNALISQTQSLFKVCSICPIAFKNRFKRIYYANYILPVRCIGYVHPIRQVFICIALE